MESLGFAPTLHPPAWTVFDAPAADPFEPTPAVQATGDSPARAARRRGADRPRAAQVLRPRTLRTGELLDDRYRFGEPLGCGGMAEVYAAEDLHDPRPLAVKILDGELAVDDVQCRRFRQEYAILSAISHPNFVPAFAFGEDREGVPFFVMERLMGPSLAVLLSRRRRLPAETAVALACQLCDALTALHRAGVVHRDVKPANICVTGALLRPRIKLLDLGIAKVAGSPEEPHDGLVSATPGYPWTRHGIILGTPGYAPPEAGCSPVAPTYDVYAVGVLLYHTLTGNVPFATPAAAASDPPPGLADVDLSAEFRAELEEILAGALDPYPAQRTSTVHELADELGSFAARIAAESSTREEPSGRGAPSRDRHRSISASATLRLLTRDEDDLPHLMDTGELGRGADLSQPRRALHG